MPTSIFPSASALNAWSSLLGFTPSANICGLLFRRFVEHFQRGGFHHPQILDQCATPLALRLHFAQQGNHIAPIESFPDDLSGHVEILLAPAGMEPDKREHGIPVLRPYRAFLIAAMFQFIELQQVLRRCAVGFRLGPDFRYFRPVLYWFAARPMLCRRYEFFRLAPPCQASMKAVMMAGKAPGHSLSIWRITSRLNGMGSPSAPITSLSFQPSTRSMI